jgi:hypothetical protein
MTQSLQDEVDALLDAGKWITGDPRATVFQYSKPNKVKTTEY